MVRSELQGGTPKFVSFLRNMHQTQATELFDQEKQSRKTKGFLDEKQTFVKKERRNVKQHQSQKAK
jgi:hypothetical protein